MRVCGARKTCLALGKLESTGTLTFRGYQLFVDIVAGKLPNSIGEEKTVPTFLSVMGAKTFNLLRSLIQPDKPGDRTYEVIVQTLARHFSPQPLIIAEHFRFHERNQEEGESMNMFVATMKRLAEHCEFKESLSEVIRDRLVCGLRSEAIQKRLLTEKALTLDRAVEISVSMEMAAKEAHQLSSSFISFISTFHYVLMKSTSNATGVIRWDMWHLNAGART